MYLFIYVAICNNRTSEVMNEGDKMKLNKRTSNKKQKANETTTALLPETQFSFQSTEQQSNQP